MVLRTRGARCESPSSSRELFCVSRGRWQLSVRTHVLTAVVFLLLACGPPANRLQAQLADPSSPVDYRLQQDAIRAIPFQHLTPEAQVRLGAVVARPSIYRRLPVTVVDSDPDLFLFLIRYPEIVVNMWDLMGVTKAQVKRTSDFTFEATDGGGTVSRVELVYGDRETQVLFAEGIYDGPLLRHLIRGRCVLVLRSAYQQTVEQRVYITNQLDMFVQLDNLGAEILAKTLHPLVGKSADQNFVESTKFLGQISQAAETKSDKVLQLAERLTKVDPRVREQFAVVTAVVGERAAARGGVSSIDRRASDLPAIGGMAHGPSEIETALRLEMAVDASDIQRKPLRLRR